MTWYNENAIKLQKVLAEQQIDFLSIDVETANASLASICQIGISAFKDGNAVCVWSTLVNPEDYFSPINISIHGIYSNNVKMAPKWTDIFPYIESILKNQVVITYTPFDRGALGKTSKKYELPIIQCTWLDAARIVRRTWIEFSHSGYGLKNVANHLGIQFKHHDAGDDAMTCGKIVCKAMEKTMLDIQEWTLQAQTPINQTTITTDGDPAGPLPGEVVVFTGKIFVPRKQAAILASRLGWGVEEGVTKRTSILICGDQDINVLNGHEKSTKHRKAETLIEQGQSIRILAETDFVDLTKIYL